MPVFKDRLDVNELLNNNRKKIERQYLVSKELFFVSTFEESDGICALGVFFLISRPISTFQLPIFDGFSNII